MTSCREVRAKLFAAFEHALDVEETFALERHLRTCSACAEEARRARSVHESLAQMSAAPLPRIDIERNVRAVREAIDRRVVAPRSRRVQWIAAAASIVALVVAARVLLVKSLETDSHAPRIVEQVPVPEPAPVHIPEPVVDAQPPQAVTVVELAPLEPIDTARLEVSRAGVRAAIVAMLPALDAGDVAAFVDGVDRATRDLARSGWPVARIVERCADDPDVRVSTGALRWLGRRGDALAVHRLESALIQPEQRMAAAAALVDAFEKRDPAALAALLARNVRSGSRPLDAQFALDLVVREKLVAALPWIEELARERGQRGDLVLARAAVDALAAFDDASALRALLRLRESPRLESETVTLALAAHLTRSTRAALELARDRSASHRAEELRALNEAVLEEPRASFVPVWIELAAAKELSRGDRRSAILLAGEHGRSEHLEALADLLRRFDRNERDLKAAVLIALHTIGGEEALANVLAATPKEARTRILELFLATDRIHKPETRLFELARRLEPLISPLQL